MALDIPALVESVVASAFDFASSIQVAMIYRRVIPGTYSPSAGTDPQSTADTAIKVIPLSFKSDEVDGVLVKAGDKKLLIRASELPTQPKQDDYLLQGSVRWDVTGYVVPTTDRLWIVGVRRQQP